MSATSVKLLQAAAEIVGGNVILANRLGIDDMLLASYLADRRELPDALLLRAVDIVLADQYRSAKRSPHHLRPGLASAENYGCEQHVAAAGGGT